MDKETGRGQNREQLERSELERQALPRIIAPAYWPDMLTFRQVGIQAFLNHHKSGLAKTEPFIPDEAMQRKAFSPPRLPHTVATWIGRVCRRFNVSPGYVLMVLQAEQGLVVDSTVRETGFELRMISGGPNVRDPGPGYYLSQKRLIKLEKGDHKMVFATGYGAPDPGQNVGWDIFKYAGIERQIYFTAFDARNEQDEWRRGNHIIDLGGNCKAGDYPDLVKDAHPSEILHHVVCSDPQIKVLLDYTPNLGVLTMRPKIFNDLGLAI